MSKEAPGLKQRRNADGTIVSYWVAREVSRRAGGYPLRTVRLHGTEAEIADRCRILTAELREWLDIGEAPVAFTGTLASLVECYERDEDSPYRAVRANTRSSYDYNLRILKRAVGERRIDRLTRKDFAAWHRRFAEPIEGGEPRVRRAHGLMTMLRALFSFGASMRYAGCRDAKDVLGEMAFPTPRRRSEAMTFAQAAAIVDNALAAPDTRSIALGQALQFELGLRQIDVIGQWVDAGNNQTKSRLVSDYPTSGIVHHGKRWSGGITWTDLSAERLAKRTSKTGAEGQWNPAEFPLLVKAIAAFAETERIGPAIIDERSGRPYGARRAWSTRWRKVADEAGVPRTVWNMDSRAGALSEASDAGAAAEDMREFATHANVATTTRYIRRSLDATTRVARLRVKHREGKKDG